MGFSDSHVEEPVRELFGEQAQARPFRHGRCDGHDRWILFRELAERFAKGVAIAPLLRRRGALVGLTHHFSRNGRNAMVIGWALLGGKIALTLLSQDMEYDR